jgi:monothiol glutaredoxin
MSVSPEVKARLDQIIASDDVVLFMKGNRNFPQCGFSATVVQILNGFLEEYTTVNVLTDADVRQGIKDYSQWPTIPQLYVKGEFVGGCDIVRELSQSGELRAKLGVDFGTVDPPTIHVTEAAAEQLKAALADADPGDCVRLSVSSRFEHGMELGPKGKDDLEVQSAGLTLLIDPISAKRANGLKVDFLDRGLAGAGFKIENPNAPTDVVQLSPKELKAMLDSGEIKEVFDVRTTREQEIATLGYRLLDDEIMAHIETLPKDTPIAFHCHRGTRSNSAAQHFRDKGFTKLYNLAGGIDAWSQEVDPAIPRY